MKDTDSAHVIQRLEHLRERFLARLALFMSGEPNLFPKQWRGPRMENVTALHKNLSRRIERAKAAAGSQAKRT